MYVGNISLGNETVILDLKRRYTRVNIFKQSGSGTGSVTVQFGVVGLNNLYFQLGDGDDLDLTTTDIITINSGASGDILFDSLKFTGTGLTGNAKLYIVAWQEVKDGIKTNELDPE